MVDILASHVKEIAGSIRNHCKQLDPLVIKTPIDQYLVEQENYELNEVLKKLKSAAKKAGKHVWKHKKKYAAGALAVGGAALIGKSKLKARQNRRNETQAAAANQRLADDEAKVKAKKEAEDNKKVSGAKPVQQQKPNANPNQIKNIRSDNFRKKTFSWFL